MDRTEIEITVIDDSDVVGWFAAFFRLGEVYMTDVKTMVTNVTKKAGTKKISRLNILDHGNSQSIQIGDDRITGFNINGHKPQLKRLKPLFPKSGFVHLQHCDIGQNQRLLIELSKIFGVPVYAGTGQHNPVYRFNKGDYVRCLPDESCLVDVARP